MRFLCPSLNKLLESDRDCRTHQHHEILHPNRRCGSTRNLEQIQARHVRQLRRQLLHHAAGSALAGSREA